MAQLPERRVREIVDDKGFVKRTENTITDTDRLFKELETIRERGFAINDQERIKLEMGLGVPIVDPDDGGPIGALSISAPSQRWNRNDLVDELADHLMEVKTELELSIAYE